MKLGIRSKLAVVWIALVAVLVVLAELYLTPRLDRLLTDRIKDDLFVRLALCEREAATVAAHHPGDREWGLLSKQLGPRAGGRVTFIAADGRVLGDTDVADDVLGELENHLGRPEVQDALAHGRGASTRHSATLRQRMMYAAMPVHADGAVVGVVRLAVPLTHVDEAIADLRRLLLTAAALMLVAAFLMSSVAAHWVSGTLRRLTEAASTMAAGDLSVRTRVGGQDEIARLSRALDRLAESLSQSLGALRDERDLQDRILRGMHEGILLLGPDGRVLLLNPALRDMLLLGSDLVGRPLLDIIRQPALKELLDQARGTVDEVSGELDVQGLKPRRLLVHATRLAGEPAGLLAVFVDVTDLRRLETLRRDFVANASHELRTPIAAVRAAADTLADAIHHAPADAPSFVEIVQRNGERLQHLVDNLLDLSRIESRELRLRPEPVALSPFVRQLLSPFEDRARRRRLQLVTEVPDRLEPFTTDRRALEQVLTNLVDNAVKYSSEGARVVVRAQAEPARLLLTVEDSGPGIELAHLPRLFERFYRVDAGRSRELGGTGLGLSIVKHLVEAMGGSIAVDSVVGRGTRFEVSLPRTTGVDDATYRP